jgi:hypothetical protein
MVVIKDKEYANLRDAILEPTDLTTEEVHVPEWGMTIRVRTITATEREQLYMSIEDSRTKNEPTNFMARLVAASVVDETGNKIFQMTDAVRIGNKSGSAVNRIADVAIRLSGIGQAQVEELRKN